SGVSPHFSVIDERGQRDLIEEAREAVMEQAAAMERNAPLVEALTATSAMLHDISLADLLPRLVGKRQVIADLELGHPPQRDAVFNWLAATLNVSPQESEDEVIGAEFGDAVFDARAWTRAGDVLARGSTNDQKAAERVHILAGAKTPAARYLAHCGVMLTTAGAIRQSIMTKTLGKSHPDIADWLEMERARAEMLLHKLAGISTLAATRSLLIFADAVIGHYQRLKALRGFLDYDDLIARARSLLTRSDDAAWVLYKLDGGIDHILVDEAQDTSREQWDIVQYLAEDMLAGQTARASDARATFAVGDEKQSIFSFQGADPAMFAEMRDFFERRANDAGRSWQRVPLERSYRSAPEILAAVDQVFSSPSVAAGLSADGAPPRHEAVRNVCGRVEIWPTCEPDQNEKPDPWTTPLDYVGPGDPKVKLARTIAEEIDLWLRTSRRIESLDRPVRPGDIMILVRRRNAFVDAVVRELKSRSVPVAGVDRMRLTDQIVVQDLIALARFVLLPEDDLSLAALIKSPIIGLGEDDLFTIAHDRKTSLWRSLQSHASGDKRLEVARHRLAGWLAMADQMAPHTFFARVLAEDGMRRRIAGRLGPESEDPISEFLNAALEYERDHLVSMDGFLAWLLRSQGEIKRDMDHGRDEVRVMTVHGAKGLEANIVILPDTCQTPSEGSGVRLYDLKIPGPEDIGDLTLPVWPRRGAANVIEAIHNVRDKTGEANQAEYLRLLYVAMTRARDWLIITGFETSRKRPDDCWYSLVRQGLEDRLVEETSPEGTTRWLFDHQPVPGAASDDKGPDQHVAAPVPGLPGWACQPLVDAVPAEAHIAPSRALSYEDGLISPLKEGSEQRFSRGLAMHGLLEHLAGVSRQEWRECAYQFLDRTAPDLEASIRAGLVEEVLGVLNAPAFAPFLTEGSRSEVAFAASIVGPDGASFQVDGRLDRLAIVDGTVHAVDFKTNRPAPRAVEDIAASYLAQMALYRAALQQVFTASPVEVALLWTDTACLMPIPGDVLDEAFHTALSRRQQSPA
ncbi:MAG: double-strand break repair helicase AddA, partial [Rhizobiales bacterium]|nr:double-strand break repair helicase AddA [Hyphomicrobiales bacterium]